MKQAISSCLHFPETVSTLDWAGSRSQRFKGSRHHYESASKDAFLEGTVIAKDMAPLDKGRKHYNILPIESNTVASPHHGLRTYDMKEKFRTIDKPYGIKTIPFQPLPIKQRPERLHVRDDRDPMTIFDKSQGIRTNKNNYIQALRHYVVEDRMQRKIRANRPDKSTYFGDWDSRKQILPHPEDFGASRRRLYRSIDSKSYALNDSIDAARKLNETYRS